MSTFAELKRNLKKDFSQLKGVRLAVLADSATQLWVQALRGSGYESGLNIEIYEADYDQIERQILDTSSELHRFKPRFVLVFYAAEKLLARFQELPLDARAGFAEGHIDTLRQLVDVLGQHLAATVICTNYPEIDDGVFGSFANKVSSSWVYQIRKANFQLMDLAQSVPNLLVSDLSLLCSQLGRDAMTDRKIAITTDLLFSIDFLPVAARSVVDIVAAASGRFKKCLVLDLDNTLWGGVIGDDGVEAIEIGGLGVGAAYSQLQRWAKELKNRGVLLAVSSKNDPRVAAEPFQVHPDMVLRLDDFAVFCASWENKVDNIRHIQSILEIGFDSMVFVDDDPAEREIVRRNLPDVCVPELPDDPALYLPYLQRLNLFETTSSTAEDGARTRQVREEGRRRELKATFATEEEFLRSLEMTAEVEPLTAFNLPRVAQLIQRSSQFNLRTIRYSEDEVHRIARSPHHLPFAVSLTDRLGSYGLVSVVFLERAGDALFIDTWLMSCRVLRRGLESFVLNALVDRARREGYATIVGEYVPTKKNELAKDHYKTLGFYPRDGRWHLDVRDYELRTTFVHSKVLPHGE
ncbi:HAD-IIIC family phosphatase [Sorangium sp. So ce1014]|uniref:HAD-IIIC family phosphatase n=1 Tax=Sorangium sp. So ce1014 TaxID=3133326 RepID=UPI003F5FA687